MPTSRICNIGACFTDLIAYGPRMPKPGETVHGTKFSTGFGGKGANQAVQAARLGAEVMMISKVGDDKFGDDTLHNFEQQGVDAQHVTRATNVASGVAPITVDETTGQNSIIIIPGALDTLSAADAEAARAEIRGCCLLMAQLEAPLGATLAALSVAREEGVTTLLNTAPARQLPDQIWPLCDIICPNEPELRELTGLPTGTEEEVAAAAQELLKKGAGKVLVTLGERGCALFTPGAEPLFALARAAEARDTTGAGDSFLGALAARMAAGAELREAMAWANEVAAVSVTREGTQKSFPTAEEMLARHAISLIDHTSLGLDDTESVIRNLMDGATANRPHPAAVCIYPKFVKFARALQRESPDRYGDLRVCTVVNFPGGKEPLDKVVADTRQAVQDGAHEIDVVIDYNLLKEDEQRGRQAAEALVRAVRTVCPAGEVLLKVIIESGELSSDTLIATAAEASIAGGCDFVKTSTGKVKVNATPGAARVMLRAIAAHSRASGPGARTIGFKAAGGVRDAAQAREYLELAAEEVLGGADRWREVDSQLLRFGASSLLSSLRGLCRSGHGEEGVGDEQPCAKRRRTGDADAAAGY
mmetsp:Transcript_113089/g.292441  ORF Transcript_113089/g.292441 Transcript_113089/m.292441 type:complete len:590 (+) Transcript_113089:88-1857(+)